MKTPLLALCYVRFATLQRNFRIDGRKREAMFGKHTLMLVARKGKQNNYVQIMCVEKNDVLKKMQIRM